MTPGELNDAANAAQRAACARGDHAFVKVYARPWWRLFRKLHLICCWACPLRIPEPSWLTVRVPPHEQGDGWPPVLLG